MTTDYIIIENFLNENEIVNILKCVHPENSRQGRYGDRVHMDKKIRLEYGLNDKELLEVENNYEHLRNKLYKKFNVFGLYREKWKIGHYLGSNNGFYVEHRDNQSRIKHRDISCICMLSNEDDYEGGELHFKELKKEFRLKKGSAIFFNSNLLHGVKPVTKGERFILLSFISSVESGLKKSDFQLSHFVNNEVVRKYLLPITPDSGPGNQIMGIKESMLVAKFLNRICILPPIHSHYTNKTRKVWPFDEIYKINNDHMSVYYKTNKKYNFNKIYGCHSKYTFDKLKLEKYLSIDNKETILLEKKCFRCVDDFEELKKKDDNVLCLKHLFNHVQFNTCRVNNCSMCRLNPHFERMYKDICILIDFSDKIKSLANDYINEHLNEKFISFHLRYPDNIDSSKHIGDYTDYDEHKIYNILETMKKEKNINKVFIATNRVNILKKSPLSEYNLYNVDIDNPINSFVEQYICACSEIFILSKYNDYRKVNEQHTRSTWSSFVLDYRVYKNNNKNNIYIQSLL